MAQQQPKLEGEDSASSFPGKNEMLNYNYIQIELEPITLSLLR